MSQNEDWFEETHEDIALRFRLKERILKKKSQFQEIELVETQGHGKLLAHDGMIMVTEKDEFIYHDMIAHVPLYTHPEPKNVLVIGGGDGGTDTLGVENKDPIGHSFPFVKKSGPQPAW